MGARLVAGACAIALAGMSGGGVREATEAWRPVVVRVSMPLPAVVGRGHVSVASVVGDTRWSLAAASSGREKHARFSLVIVAEPAGDAE